MNHKLTVSLKWLCLALAVVATLLIVTDVLEVSAVYSPSISTRIFKSSDETFDGVSSFYVDPSSGYVAFGGRFGASYTDSLTFGVSDSSELVLDFKLSQGGSQTPSLKSGLNWGAYPSGLVYGLVVNVTCYDSSMNNLGVVKCYERAGSIYSLPDLTGETLYSVSVARSDLYSATAFVEIFFGFGHFDSSSSGSTGFYEFVSYPGYYVEFVASMSGFSLDGELLDSVDPTDPDIPTSAEVPVFTVNVPLVPWYEYNFGDTPDPVSVEATVSDGGTVSYTWFQSDWTNTDDISMVEYSAGNTLTIDTSTVGEYHYVCRATNTNGSYVNSCYSNTLVVKIVESGAADLPEPTPTYPSADDIGSSVGDAFQDVLDQNDINTSEQGNSFVDQITQIVPNESQGFVNAMGGLVDSLSYDGTECVLTVPALVMPQIGDLVPQYTLLEKQTVDLESYFNMFPAFIVTLVQSLFTVALIVFCFKELYSTVSYFFVLRGGET